MMDRQDEPAQLYGMARPFSPWWDSLPGCLAKKEGSMANKIAILGIDLGKNSCSVVGLDAAGAVVKRRRMRPETLAMFTQNLPAGVIAMEACCGAHHLARLFTAQGHEVRLMSPEYVRVCEGTEERRSRCRSNRRGHNAANDARDLAAWLGLVPRQIATGGKPRLVGITKRGNKYLRKLLIHGARAALPSLRSSETPLGSWLRGLIARAHKNAAVVALANKLARIAWSVLRHGGKFNATSLAMT